MLLICFNNRKYADHKSTLKTKDRLCFISAASLSPVACFKFNVVNDYGKSNMSIGKITNTLMCPLRVFIPLDLFNILLCLQPEFKMD